MEATRVKRTGDAEAPAASVGNNFNFGVVADRARGGGDATFLLADSLGEGFTCFATNFESQNDGK